MIYSTYLISSSMYIIMIYLGPGTKARHTPGRIYPLLYNTYTSIQYMLSSKGRGRRGKDGRPAQKPSVAQAQLRAMP